MIFYYEIVFFFLIEHNIGITNFVDNIVKNDNFTDLQNTRSFSLLTSNPDKQNIIDLNGKYFY